MADQPRLQEPYSNFTPVPFSGSTAPKVPAGKNISKRSQADLAIQGLVGAK